jgi:DNA-binding NtrC family response regulator
MPSSNGPRKVLVVDDEVIIADTLRLILASRGYEAFAVYNAEEALDWCRNGCPDVVITDVIMGPMNGVELAVRLAESLPECKVLLISGHAVTSSLLEDAPARGLNFPIMAKPVHPEQILEFVANAYPQGREL